MDGRESFRPFRGGCHQVRRELFLRADSMELSQFDPLLPGSCEYVLIQTGSACGQFVLVFFWQS